MAVIRVCLPLDNDLGADIVTLQMANLNQGGLIEMLGSDVLSRLKRAAAQHG